MPPSFSLIGVLPLKVLCRQVLRANEGSEKDFEFIKGAPQKVIQISMVIIQEKFEWLVRKQSLKLKYIIGL